MLYDPQGKEVGRSESNTTVGANQQTVVSQTLTVAAPVLWSTESPNLYSAVSRVKVGDKVVDEYPGSFGIRDIRFDAQQGFFLNGKNMKLKGVCLHHEAGVLGAAVPDAVWQRRLKNLRSIGCNAIRTAHNPVAPEFLDLCDRLGFLVMDEFVDKWVHKVRPNADPLIDPAFAEPHFEIEWEKNFRETIRRDRNHPSVIIWSVGNENNPPGEEEENRRTKLYRDFVRSIDTTRPVVSGMERGKDKLPSEKVDDILETCEFMDLIAMNYGEQWVRRIANRNPGKPFVSTESYTYFNSTEEKRFANLERSPWIDVIENDSNMGLFLWVGIDYLGEVSGRHFRWPAIGVDCGLFDYAGFRKPSSYLYESFWSDEPMVYLAVYTSDPDDFSDSGRWGWPPMNETWNLPEGSDVNLACYSNCDFVELFLNGRKLGTQRMADFKSQIMKWRKIDYQPGTLRAVGIRDGQAACEFELHTTGPPERIEFTADAETLKTGGTAHLEVSVLDADGNRVTDQEVELNFQVEGGGEVLGLDNGDVHSHHHALVKDRCPTHEGRCLAIVRAGDFPGTFAVTVSAKGISQKKFTCRVSL